MNDSEKKEIETLTEEIKKARINTEGIKRYIWDIFKSYLRESIPTPDETSEDTPKKDPLQKVSELIREVKEINNELTSIPKGVLRKIEQELKKL